jgi:electron transfer flavoprotein alpha subunit
MQERALSVWVVAEWRGGRLRDISLGLLGEGKRVAQASESLCALVLGDGQAGELQRLLDHGADEVLLLDLPTSWDCQLHLVADAIAALVAEHQPRLLLCAAGPVGNELAGRLAVACRAGLVTNATRLELEGDQVVIVKGTWKDHVDRRLVATTHPQLVTLRGRELQPLVTRGAPRGCVVRPPLPIRISRRRIWCSQGDGD